MHTIWLCSLFDVCLSTWCSASLCWHVHAIGLVVLFCGEKEDGKHGGLAWRLPDTRGIFTGMHGVGERLLLFCSDRLRHHTRLIMGSKPEAFAPCTCGRRQHLWGEIVLFLSGFRACQGFLGLDNQILGPLAFSGFESLVGPTQGSGLTQTLAALAPTRWTPE